MQFLRTPKIIEYLLPDCLFGSKQKDGKELYLTFDDGPGEMTPEICRILQQYDLPATFFIAGESSLRYPEVLENTYSQGFHIGYHGWSHIRWLNRNRDLREQEISPYTQGNVSKYFSGEPSKVFIRPPFGIVDYPTLQWIRNQKFRITFWRSTAYDWEASSNPEKITANLLGTVRDGDIILLHDGGEPGIRTAKALSTFIPILLERGFQFHSLLNL